MPEPQPADDLSPTDRELLERAELALTQVNNRHGLETDQSATLTAIRLRLEGKSRASLDDLLVAGRDLGDKDPPDRGHDQAPAVAPASRTSSPGRRRSPRSPWTTCLSNLSIETNLSKGCMH